MKCSCTPPLSGDLAFSNLSIDSSSSYSVTLRYELTHGLVCLLKTRPASTDSEAKICMQEAKGPNKYCSISESAICRDFDLPHDYRSVESFVGTWDSPIKLSGDTPYIFTTFVSYGNLVNCTSVQVRTREGIPSGPPENVSFSVGQERTMLLLTWLPPPTAKRNGNISHYQVLFWNKSADSSPREVIVNGSQLEYMEEYDSSWDYSYAIAACTSRGCGPSYNDTTRAGGISEHKTSEGTL